MKRIRRRGSKFRRTLQIRKLINLLKEDVALRERIWSEVYIQITRKRQGFICFLIARTLFTLEYKPALTVREAERIFPEMREYAPEYTRGKSPAELKNTGWFGPMDVGMCVNARLSFMERVMKEKGWDKLATYKIPKL